MSVNPKKKAIVERIKSIEGDLVKAREYLLDGSHAHWHGFRPMFADKIKDGKVLPPHTDWVKNVFIPGREKALDEAEKLLDRLDS